MESTRTAPLTLALSLALSSIVLPGCFKQPTEAPQTKPPAVAPVDPAQQKAEAERAEREAILADCQTTLEDRKAEHKRLMAKREYWPAALAIRQCAQILDDPALKKLVAAAETNSYLEDIKNPGVLLFDRVQRIEALRNEYPEQAKAHDGLFRKIIAEYERSSAHSREAARRNTTPTIGMAAGEVIANSWGYPERINKTTNARGVREQWVYGNGRYLYFDNGVLVTIQE